jgi:hypothetical protein
MKVKSITGIYWRTFEEATRLANKLTRDTGVYHTAIKGAPENNNIPEYCWATTNKYDPRAMQPAKSRS